MVTDSISTAHIIENFLILLLSSFVPTLSSSTHAPLRINSLHIPTPVVTGESVLLTCNYELGNETLYAVKWYKNMGEFFRYVPRSIPQFKILHQPGVKVDVARSDHMTVYLKDMDLESFGNYTCQVSTDRPYFRCVQTTRQLDVVVPPSDGPMLMEEKSDYVMGDNVSIMCSSGKAKPAPELKWYINDRLANSDPFDQETIVYPEGLESSSLTLRFNLKPDVFRNGKVILKCVAIAPAYHLESTATREIRAQGARVTASIMPLVWLTAVATLIRFTSLQVLPA